MLIESNAKPIDDRLGNSPEKIEKRAGGKKSIYAHSYNKIKNSMKFINNNHLLYWLGLKQTTLQFKSKAKKEKDDKKKDKDSDSNDDIDFGSISPPPAPRTSRRAAAGINFHLICVKFMCIFNMLIFTKFVFDITAKKNYNYSSAESSSSDEILSVSSDMEQWVLYL